MSLEVQEKISSLFDDELNASDSEQVITRLKTDNDSLQCWSRYALISDALKKNLSENPQNDLLSRVQLALESEPALLAPAPGKVETAQEPDSAVVVELPKKAVPEKSFNPAVGFGIAATVALVSVLGFKMFSVPTDMPVEATIADANQPVPVVTQELNIVSTPSIASSPATVSAPTTTVAIEESISGTAEGDPAYAEQSLFNDGQWTRITPIDSASLENDILFGKGESPSIIQNGVTPFARAVSLENSPAE